MANIQPVEHPNQFDLEGDGVSVSYSETSPTGDPLFSYQDGSRAIQRRGDEISTREMENIGTLVTVEIEREPDLRTVSFSLLLPTINLPEGAGASTLQTVGVLTTELTTIVGPQVIVGQVQTYQGLMLRGKAQLVTP